MAKCSVKDSSFGVFDQQSVGSSPGRVLEEDTLPLLLCSLDGTLSCWSRVLGLVVDIRMTLVVEEWGLPQSMFLVRITSKHPCLHVSSGLRATVIKFT